MELNPTIIKAYDSRGVYQKLGDRAGDRALDAAMNTD